MKIVHSALVLIDELMQPILPFLSFSNAGSPSILWSIQKTTNTDKKGSSIKWPSSFLLISWRASSLRDDSTQLLWAIQWAKISHFLASEIDLGFDLQNWQNKKVIRDHFTFLECLWLSFKVNTTIKVSFTLSYKRQILFWMAKINAFAFWYFFKWREPSEDLRSEEKYVKNVDFKAVDFSFWGMCNLSYTTYSYTHFLLHYFSIFSPLCTMQVGRRYLFLE